MNGELARRIGFTIGALLLFRLGTHVPVPGVLTSSLQLTAGVVARLSLFALGLVPYFSAAILIRLLSVVWRGLNALERSGEAGRRSIARLTLALTLVLAAFQAYGIASALKDVPNLVSDPEGWFVITATATMVGGVFALIFLSEQITRHGIGNGLALVLSVGFLVALPSDVSNVRELIRSGSVSSDLVLFHIVFWVAAVVLIVVVESARRNIGIAFAERSVGARILPARTALLPVKLNNAGFLIPTTVAPWFIFLPLSAAGFLLGGVPWIEALYQSLQVGRHAHLIVLSVAVFVLAFVYTSFVFDPEEVAEQLARQGGAIPGIAPGEATADRLDRVVSLTTIVGAVYLTLVQMIPEALLVYGNGLPYSMSGGAAVIVVCTILDLQTQVRDVSLTNPGGVRR